MLARVLCMVAVLALGGAGACTSAGHGRARPAPSGVESPASPTTAHRRAAAWLIWLQDHLITYGSFI